MRMRKKKHGAERIAACSELLIEDVTALKDGLMGVFSTPNPIHLEIGCGKGNFASGMAAKHADVNFIAMERVADVCCIALEKAKARADERPSDNLRFIIGDAKTLSDNFPAHSLDCIYLNFSDPWPKSGHAKRRLTHSSFLSIYKELLTENGILRIKTDNVGLFDFTLEELCANAWEIIWQTRDLHSQPENADNVMTEYEKNFSDKGMPINSVWARPKK